MDGLPPPPPSSSPLQEGDGTPGGRAKRKRTAHPSPSGPPRVLLSPPSPTSSSSMSMSMPRGTEDEDEGGGGGGRGASKRRRSPYKCHKCGKPKKGHICTAQVDPSSLALFRERDARPPQPFPPPLTSSTSSTSIASISSSSIAYMPMPSSSSTSSTSSGDVARLWPPRATTIAELDLNEDDEDDEEEDEGGAPPHLHLHARGNGNASASAASTTSRRSASPVAGHGGGAHAEQGRQKRRGGGRARGGRKKRVRPALSRGYSAEGEHEEDEDDEDNNNDDDEGEDEDGDAGGGGGGGGSEEMASSFPPSLLGELAEMYNTSSDNLFPTDALSRYELGSMDIGPPSSSWANWGSLEATTAAAADDFDISLFGYIDERPPERVSGVGISVDQKKAPYFVSWFDMAVSGLEMLETFLKTQRPVWDALPSVLDNLKEQKSKLAAWKESFGREVVTKAIEEGGPLVIGEEERSKRASQEAAEETRQPHASANAISVPSTPVVT